MRDNYNIGVAVPSSMSYYKHKSPARQAKGCSHHGGRIFLRKRSATACREIGIAQRAARATVNPTQVFIRVNAGTTRAAKRCPFAGMRTPAFMGERGGGARRLRTTLEHVAPPTARALGAARAAAALSAPSAVEVLSGGIARARSSALVWGTSDATVMKCIFESTKSYLPKLACDLWKGEPG